MAATPGSAKSCECLSDTLSQLKKLQSVVTDLSSTLKQVEQKVDSAVQHIETHICSTQRNDSTSQVLNSTELLEAILKELPMQDLLLSQRVNKKFQATIKGSLKLQRALFLSPRSFPISSGDSSFIINPLFTADRVAFRYRLPKCKEVRTDFVNVITMPDTPLRMTLSRDICIDLCTCPPRPVEAPILDTYQPGSWQNMYLTQPPKEACVAIPIDQSEPGRLEKHKVWTFRAMEGLTLGEVLKDAERNIAEARRTW